MGTEVSKPIACPFCKESRSEDLDRTYGLSVGRTRRWWVFCLTCGAEGPLAKTRKAAIAAWNTRADGSEPTRKALEAMVNERYSELDMMSCEYPRGSAEAIAWESGVRQAWRLWDLSKEPGVKALQEARANEH